MYIDRVITKNQKVILQNSEITCFLMLFQRGKTMEPSHYRHSNSKKDLEKYLAFLCGFFRQLQQCFIFLLCCSSMIIHHQS